MEYPAKRNGVRRLAKKRKNPGAYLQIDDTKQEGDDDDKSAEPSSTGAHVAGAGDGIRPNHAERTVGM